MVQFAFILIWGLLAQILLLCDLDDSTWTLWAVLLFAQVGYDALLSRVDLDYLGLQICLVQLHLVVFVY